MLMVVRGPFTQTSVEWYQTVDGRFRGHALDQPEGPRIDEHCAVVGVLTSKWLGCEQTNSNFHLQDLAKTSKIFDIMRRRPHRNR